MHYGVWCHPLQIERQKRCKGISEGVKILALRNALFEFHCKLINKFAKKKNGFELTSTTPLFVDDYNFPQ